MAQDKYPFTKLVEAQVALAACSMPRFYTAIGFALDPPSMPTESAGLLVQAAQTISKVSPCTDPLHAVQHLRWMVNQGKITFEKMNKANDFLDTAEDAGGVGDMEALIATITPIIQRTMHKDALEGAISGFGKGQPAESAAQAFNAVVGLGGRSVSLGVEATGSIDEIATAASSTLKDPLPTGILELDGILQGGLESEAIGMVLGGSGDGKSLFLSHVASESVFTGYDVAYITLELSESAIRQRIYANVLNMTPGEMEADSLEAATRYRMLEQRPEGIGRWVVTYMTPRATTPDHVKTWLRDLERERSFIPDLLVVDYADKMVSEVHTKKRSYEDQLEVYEGLRGLCAEDNMTNWLWTASQTTGRAGRKKKPDLEDVSDSMNKVRVADLVLAIARTEDDCANELIRFRLPKRRNAAAHGEIGPVPMDAEHWRIVTISRNEPW